MLTELYNIDYNVFACHHLPCKQRGGEKMQEAMLSFVMAVAVNVASHYIIKWLDSLKGGK